MGIICFAAASHNLSMQLYEEMGRARLVVYFHSFTYEHVKAIKKYDEIRVLSNIGGINGMYLGLSFYLLFQVRSRRIQKAQTKNRDARAQQKVTLFSTPDTSNVHR